MAATSQTIPGIYDCTNLALLVDPAYSLMGPYVKNPMIYKCGADQSQFNGVPRVRTYSMSQAVGPTANGTLQDGTHIAGHWLSTGNASTPGSPFRVYSKESEIVGALGAADIWALTDEHPDSIGDAAFAVQMPAGWPNGRMARFLMNLMLSSGGYPWTIVRTTRRKEYLDALDAASADQNILPFAQFIREEMSVDWANSPRR